MLFLWPTNFDEISRRPVRKIRENKFIKKRATDIQITIQTIDAPMAYGLAEAMAFSKGASCFA